MVQKKFGDSRRLFDIIRYFHSIKKIANFIYSKNKKNLR